MPYCTNCGKQIKADDRFCYYCGAEVLTKRGAPAPEPPKASEASALNSQKYETQAATFEVEPQNAVNSPELCSSRKPVKKKWLFIIAGAAVIIAAAVIVIIALSNKVKWLDYSNEASCFSISYPDSLSMIEPDSGGVVLTDSDTPDVQLSVEYSYRMTNGGIIYSAKDFYNQITDDPSRLRDWLGVEDAVIEDGVQGKINGQDSYSFGFSFDNNGARTGQLTAVEGTGDLGCYIILCVVNQDNKKAEKYAEMCAESIESFEVTGDCAPDSYESIMDENLKFFALVPAGSVANSSDTDSSRLFYPLNGVYGECSVSVEISSSSADHTPEKELNMIFAACDALYDAAEITMEPEKIDMGRYDYTLMGYMYIRDCCTINTVSAVFPVGDRYWIISADASDANYETAVNLMSSIMSSIIVLE